MNIHSIYGFFMARFRPGRIAAMRARFPQIDGVGRILDVGGAPGWWRQVQPKNTDLTIINLDNELRDASLAAGFKFETANACALPYQHDEFDLIVSNSLIEHVGDWAAQQRCAKELLRCAPELYVQTPNKWFFVEPHLVAPFVHWLPRSVQRKTIRWLSVWGWVTRPDQKTIDAFIDSTRLLSKREMALLFPGCEIGAEKFLGMTKSILVFRTAPSPSERAS